MAYRTAEQTRWRQFDFVVGFEVKTTQNGKHQEDICDRLKGRYPKDFKWVGWHPQCLCYAVSILKTEEEFWRDLGGDTPGKSEKEVTDVPQEFKDWVRDNADRIEKAEKRGTQPYFIRDKQKRIDEILKHGKSNQPSAEYVSHILGKSGSKAIDGEVGTGEKRGVKSPLSDIIKERRKEIRKIANETIADKSFELPGLQKQVSISRKGIKEWLNQPHEHIEEKNEMLLNIETVLNQSKYLGCGQDKHDSDAIAHIYAVGIKGNKSWIIIREMHNGSLKIHSISDSETIVEKILSKK